MRQDNDNIFKMWDAVIAYVTASTFPWMNLKPFNNGIIKLKDLRAAASKAGQRQAVGSEGDTNTKDLANNRMVSAGMRIVNNAHPYAISIEDKKLEAATDLSTSTLNRMSPNERADAVDALVTAVRGSLEGMADYPAVTDASLTALSGQVQAFRDSTGEQGAGIAEHSAATETTDAIRHQGQLLLKKTLDRLVRNFEDDDAAFVSGWFNARVIRHTGGGHSGGGNTPPVVK